MQAQFKGRWNEHEFMAEGAHTVFLHSSSVPRGKILLRGANASLGGGLLIGIDGRTISTVRSCSRGEKGQLGLWHQCETKQEKERARGVPMLSQCRLETRTQVV